MPHKPDSHPSGCQLFQLNPVTGRDAALRCSGRGWGSCGYMQGGRAAASQNRSLHPPPAHPPRPIPVEEGPSRGHRDLGQRTPAASLTKGSARKRQPRPPPGPHTGDVHHLGVQGTFPMTQRCHPTQTPKAGAGERKTNLNYRTSYRKRTPLFMNLLNC